MRTSENTMHPHETVSIRRAFLRAASLVPLAASGLWIPGRAAANTGWSYDKYVEAYKASGRNPGLSAEAFARLQVRREAGLKRIEQYLKSRFGDADPLVMKAFGTVPREYYHHDYAGRRSFSEAAWEAEAKPWAIGFGSALSDYLGQAYMTQLAKPTPDSVVLEIGTGSGFQISAFSRIVRRAYSIEIIEPLGKGVAPIFKPLGYDNVETRVGDGFFGWPEVKEGFDIIIFTCAAQYVPPPLFDQLKKGGRLLVPIGQPFKRGQVLYVYTKDDNGKIHSKKDVGVFFIPMTGQIEKAKPAA